MLQHNLNSLSLWYCDSLSNASWEKILKHGDNLKTLELGKGVDILRLPDPNATTPIQFELKLPNIQKLVLNGIVLTKQTKFDCLLHLRYLDLSGCIFNEFSLECLITLPYLHALMLFNVCPLEKEIPFICKMVNLRTLDLSIARTGTGSNGTYDNPNYTLSSIVECLSNLIHLDISGTNLAGNGVAQQTKAGDSDVKGSDIPGLMLRANRPLNFLGLYNTAHWACRRHDIPAAMVIDPLKIIDVF